MPEIDITSATLDSLAAKLTEFADSLPVEEKATLEAIIILAGQQLAVSEEVTGFEVKPGRTANFSAIAGFRDGFDNSFGPITGVAPKKLDAGIISVAVN
jgi:hypothetical protein